MIMIDKISNLLRPERTDIGAKLYLLQNKKNAKEIYLDSINRLTLGSFTEDGSIKKNKEDYIEAFYDTFSKIKKNGFNSDYSLPINGGVITNGAHRLSSAIFLKHQDIPVIPSEKVNPPCYDYNFFTNRGMKNENLYCMLSSLVPYNKYLRVAILWPRAAKHETILKNMLGPLYYSCKLSLDLNGLTNFVSQVYSEEPWAGNYKNGYLGSFNKALECFQNKTNTIIYVYDFRLANKNFKNIFREHVAIDKSSIHTTDTVKEAKEIINNLIAPGIEKVLNNIPRNKTKSYHHFRNEILKLREIDNIKNIVFDAGQVMTLLGLRETEDYDFYIYGKKNIKFNSNSYFDRRNRNLESVIEDLKTSIANYPVFKFDGINYLRPEIILELKEKRLKKNGDLKDLNDIKMLEIAFNQNIEATSNSFIEKLFFYFLRFKKKLEGNS